MGVDRESVADSFDGVDSGVAFQQIDGQRHNDDSDQRTGYLFREAGREGDDGDADNAYGRCPEVDRPEILEVDYPLPGEVARHFGGREAEQILDLRGEDRHGDTAGETDDDRVGNEFDDRPQAEESQQDQEYARHDRGDGQSLDAVLLDDAIDDHDECTCGAADLYATAAERRCEEAGDDGRDDAFFR